MLQRAGSVVPIDMLELDQFVAWQGRKGQSRQAAVVDLGEELRRDKRERERIVVSLLR
jgi:hypothetical protein